MILRQIAVSLAVLVFATAIEGTAQIGTISSTQFEVVSIKPSGPQSPRGSRGGPGSAGPERYEFYSATLLDLIFTAWNVDRFQISSKVDLERDRFDVDAKVPAGVTRDQLRLMLQNMLAERFGMKAHVEQKDFDAYALRVARSGLKMQEAVEKAEVKEDQSGGRQTDSTQDKPYLRARQSLSGSFELFHIDAHLQTFSFLAIRLLKPDGLPVVDQTGLTGRYNFTLDYSQDQPGPSDLSAPPAPSLSTALGQLGLELVRQKLPFTVVVVDSLNREPTPN
jgi:uncharacterized protein (TIGR03435 family)